MGFAPLGVNIQEATHVGLSEDTNNTTDGNTTLSVSRTFAKDGVAIAVGKLEDNGSGGDQFDLSINGTDSPDSLNSGGTLFDTFALAVTAGSVTASVSGTSTNTGSDYDYWVSLHEVSID